MIVQKKIKEIERMAYVPGMNCLLETIKNNEFPSPAYLEEEKKSLPLIP